jgi:hypothetical protein
MYTKVTYSRMNTNKYNLFIISMIIEYENWNNLSKLMLSNSFSGEMIFNRTCVNVADYHVSVCENF